MPTATNAPAPSLLDLCRSEPYRLLFPIGLMNLLLGLGVWLPALIWQQPTYPIAAHMQVIVHASMDAFIIGFLLTFLPRFAGGPFIGNAALIATTAAFLLMPPVAWIAGPDHAGLLVVVPAVVGLIAVARRLHHLLVRAPSAVLLVMGLAWAAIAPMAETTGLLMVPDALAFEAVPLLIVTGTVPMLLPKLRGGACCNLQREPSWRPLTIAFWTIAGCALLGSYLLPSLLPEAPAWLPATIRAAVIIPAVHAGLPLHRFPRQTPAFVQAAWTALWALALGVVLGALSPEHHRAFAHLAYVGGLLLLTLLIAAKVTSAHGGRPERAARAGPIWTITVCLHLAALTRAGVDWAPESRDLHLLLAAVLALAGVVVWLVHYLPLLPRRA